MLNEILNQGVMPDRLTYNTLILACVESKKFDAAMQLFEEMKVLTCIWNLVLIVLWQINIKLLNFSFWYLQGKAQEFINDDLFPDIVTYTTLLKVRFVNFIHLSDQFVAV